MTTADLPGRTQAALDRLAAKRDEFQERMEDKRDAGKVFARDALEATAKADRKRAEARAILAKIHLVNAAIARILKSAS